MNLIEILNHQNNSAIRTGKWCRDQIYCSRQEIIWEKTAGV